MPRSGFDADEFRRPFYGLRHFPEPSSEGEPHPLHVLASVWYPFGLNYGWITAEEIDDLCFGNHSFANWVWRWSQGRVRILPVRADPRVFGPYLSWHAGPFYFRPKLPDLQTEQDFRDAMSKAGLDPARLAALTPFLFPKTGSRYHGFKDGVAVFRDDRDRFGISLPLWQEAVENAANEVDLTAFAYGRPEFDPLHFMVLVVRSAGTLGGVSRPIHRRNVPRDEDFYVYPPGQYRRDGERGKGARLRSIAELSYHPDPSHNSKLATLTEELIHSLGLLDAYPDNKTRQESDPRRPSALELTDAHGRGHYPVGLDPYVRLKFGWGRPVVAGTGTHRLRPAESTGDMLILASTWRGQDEFFIVENRTAPPEGYDATRPGFYGDGLAIWHVIEDGRIHDYARLAVSLLRPTPDLNQSPLWDPSDPARSYRLDDVSSPQHLRLLGTDFDPKRPGGHNDVRPVSSGMSITGMRWAGTSIDVDVRVPVREERVLLTGHVSRLRAHSLAQGWGVPGSENYLPHAAVAELDTAPALRLGVPSADDGSGAAMFEELLGAHIDDRPVTVVYRTTGPITGEVIRVE